MNAQQDTQQDQSYNGWSNYATWGVALVLDNDEGTYNHVREQAEYIRKNRAHLAPVKDGIWTEDEAVLYTLEDFVKGFTEELCGLEDSALVDIPQPSLMAQQVLQAGLAEVDWREIAANILSEDQ